MFEYLISLLYVGNTLTQVILPLCYFGGLILIAGIITFISHKFSSRGRDHIDKNDPYTKREYGGDNSPNYFH
ncbi:hypothetical protein ACMGE9_04080 [Macrococcus sp. EM39E]|uniref:hypothetical protein n=1 Tax=Macrococcus animalis TaxID=3395467 RepID=UPI0039BE1374